MKYSLVTLTCLIFLASCEGQNKKKNIPIASKEENTGIVLTDTSSQLMNENEFWKLVEKSRNESTNYQLQVNALKTILQSLDATTIEKFNNTFISLLAATYNYKLWGAAFVINSGCSDDCFDYFRQYLIAQGKERFYETVKNPESCATWIKSEEEENWEGFQYAAIEAYKQKTGKEIPQSYQPKFELKGKPFDEETVLKQYPKLAKKFAGDNE